MQPGDKQLGSEGLSELQSIIKACQGLVSLETRSRVVRFIHFTTQDYLERHQLELSNGQAYLTKICLTYLSFDHFSRGPCDFISGEFEHVYRQIKNHQRIARSRLLSTRLADYQFLDYVANYWGDHARGEPERTLQKELINLLLSAPLLQNSTVVRTRDVYTRMNALHVSVSFNLACLTAELIKNMPTVDLDAGDHRNLTPLDRAVKDGLAEVPQILVDAGAKLRNKQELQDSTKHGMSFMLRSAIASSNEKIVRMVLESDPSLFECIEDLGYAATQMNTVVAQLCIESGRENSTRKRIASNILHEASRRYNQDMMKFAIKWGADVAGRNNNEPPLREAIMKARSRSKNAHRGRGRPSN